MQPCIVQQIERPDPELVKAIAPFGTATVHEAYKQLGLLRPEIRPIVPNVTICGPAVTTLNHAGDNLMLHAAIEQCQPGDVLVVATTAPSTDGMIGELLATQFRAHGIVGVVTDAGVRDTAILREMGFPIWARATSAAGTSKANPGWVNVPVVCGGVTVNPGDLVIADDDGVVVVAREEVPAVLKASQERTAREDVARERYARGELSLDSGGLRDTLQRLGVRYVRTLADVNAQEPAARA